MHGDNKDSYDDQYDDDDDDDDDDAESYDCTIISLSFHKVA